MKLIKNVLGVLFISGFTALLNLAHAQQTTYSTFNPSLESVTDVQAMMEALATVDPVPFDTLPKNLSLIHI